MARRIEVRFLDERIAELSLQKATAGSAGFDLRAALHEPLLLRAGESALVPTGVAIHLADPQLAALVLPRSGLGHHRGLVLGNLVGLIDSDYQGEILVSLWNRSDSALEIEPLMRVAQLVVISVVAVELVAVAEFTPSVRGAAGFGSSGTR